MKLRTTKCSTDCQPPPIPVRRKCKKPYVRIGSYCIHYQMLRIMAFAIKHGFKVVNLQRGCLQPKQKYFFSFRLRPGKYMFIARNTSGKDLDMYVRSGSGRMLGKDTKRDPVPVVRYMNMGSGRRVLHVTLRQYKGGGAFQLVVLRKRSSSPDASETRINTY